MERISVRLATVPSRGIIGIKAAATKTIAPSCPGQKLHSLDMLVDRRHVRQRAIGAAQKASSRTWLEPFLVKRAVVLADQRTKIQEAPEPASCQPAREHEQGQMLDDDGQDHKDHDVVFQDVQ